MGRRLIAGSSHLNMTIPLNEGDFLLRVLRQSAQKAKHK